MGWGGVGGMGVLKNLNKDLYVIPKFYLARYQSISILSIIGNSNKISNNKQWGTRDFYVETPTLIM